MVVPWFRAFRHASSTPRSKPFLKIFKRNSVGNILEELRQRLDRSGALVGQGSALIACLRIRTLFRRRPTEALGRGPIVRVQPRPRSLVCPLYVIKSSQSSRFIACDTLMHAATRLGFLLLYFMMSTIRDIKSKLSQKAFDALCTKYHIPASVHPSLPGSDKKMDLFAFIRHSDPTKVRVGERNLADRELKLLNMTEGRTVALDPPATAVSGGSSDSIDRLFDEGDNTRQEHSVERNDVQEEVIAKDTSEVVIEKPQKKRKRKVVGDASGSALPPKRLRVDHQSLLPRTGGKSLTALCGMVSDGFIIPSDAMRPAVTASVTPTPDVETLDSMFGLNLRTRPPHVRYVVSLDSSLHSDSYSKAASLVRSVADAPVVTVAVTTTIDANVDAGSKAKDVLREIEHI
ncbi:hypothetical protein Tco_0215679 [Tanacetum coccineum]